MLKITYTSTGATLEHSYESLETTIRQRVMLNLRVGEPLGLEPTSVSLLVNHSVPALKSLATAIAQTPTHALQIIQRGSAQVEMQLQGYWLAQPKNPGEGMFFTNLEPSLECHFVSMWRTSQEDISYCL